MGAEDNNIVRVALLRLDKDVLRDPLLDDLSLLEVRLDRLAGLDALDDLLAVRPVNKPSRRIGLEVHLAHGARGRRRREIMVDDDGSGASLLGRSHAPSQRAARRAPVPLREDDLALDVEAVVVGGVAACLARGTEHDLGRDALLGRRGRVRDAVDVEVLVVDLEGDCLDLAEPRGEVLLPRLCARHVGDVRPDVVDRGRVAGQAEGAVAVALFEGDVVEGLEMRPEAVQSLSVKGTLQYVIGRLTSRS